MNIASLDFLFFLSISFLGYTLLIPRHKKRDFLLISSLAFCCSFGIESLIIAGITIICNYVFGIMIAQSNKQPERKKLFLYSLMFNVALLAWCKYMPYFENDLSGLIHITKTRFNFIFIGLSFYTFQNISYLTEIYYKNIDAERSLPNFALYIIFFPKIIAGPIERPAYFLPQIYCEKIPDPYQIRSAFILILWGLFQKIVIADRLAVFVSAVYASPQNTAGISVWIAMFFYSFQIYCDFNGYTDIARGMAKLFGYELTQNFSQPYLADSIQDFWRRWHISLSTWFRDYLYIPLGGNRVGTKRKIFNLLMVFTICGIWHGSNWTFVIWGILHGLFISFEIAYERFLLPKFSFIKYLPHVIIRFTRTIVTFFLVSLSWMFFRADNVQDVITLLQNSIVFDSSSLSVQDGLSRDQIILSFALIAVIYIVDFLKNYCPLHELFYKQPRAIRWAFYFVVIFSIILLPGGNDIAQFIYYKF